MRIDDTTTVAFTSLLRTARESRGWAQYEAASHIGVPASTLSRLEHGPYEGMRFADVVLLCRAYGISVDSIAALVGLPTPGDEERDSEVEVLCAAMRTLETEQRQFVLRVLQAVMKGL
jgi:transcriptional regulator with XRE-family HTH domain